MNAPLRGHEHEFEPQYGLPEELPQSEKLLWQGSPDWKSMARHVFHLRKLVVYFAVIIAIRVVMVLGEGEGAMTAAISALWLTLLAGVAIGILAMIAYFSARTTVYSITSKRVVMRVGIVLTLTFNLPFKRIASADLREFNDGTGDIPLALMDNDKIAYMHLWPHVRPWRMAQPQPMLRCLKNPQNVAAVLTRAWKDSVGPAALASHDQKHGVQTPTMSAA